MEVTHFKHVGEYHTITSNFSAAIWQTQLVKLTVFGWVRWVYCSICLAEISGHIKNIVCSWWMLIDTKHG